MASQPVRLVEWSSDGDGRVTLAVRRREDRATRMLSFLVPIPRQRRVALDEIGSDVWRMCDGDTSLADMAGTLARKYKLNYKEAQQPLLRFLNDLARRGLVGFRLAHETPASVRVKQSEAGR